ncbi:hypothetical protein YB2330_000864 [Saitoella coloradoensis]
MSAQRSLENYGNAAENSSLEVLRDDSQFDSSAVQSTQNNESTYEYTANLDDTSDGNLQGGETTHGSTQEVSGSIDETNDRLDTEQSNQTGEFDYPLASSTPETLRPAAHSDDGTGRPKGYRRVIVDSVEYPVGHPDIPKQPSSRGMPGYWPSPSLNQSGILPDVHRPDGHFGVTAQQAEARLQPQPTPQQGQVNQEPAGQNVSPQHGTPSGPNFPFEAVSGPIAEQQYSSETHDVTRSSQGVYMASASDRESTLSAAQRDMAFLCQRLQKNDYRWFKEYQQMDRARTNKEVRHLDWQKLYEFMMEDKIDQREQLGVPIGLNDPLNDSMAAENIVHWLLNNERVMEDEFDMLKHWDDRMSAAGKRASVSPTLRSHSTPPRPPKVAVSPPPIGTSSQPRNSPSNHLMPPAQKAPSQTFAVPTMTATPPQATGAVTVSIPITPSSPTPRTALSGQNSSPVGTLTEIPGMPDKIVQTLGGNAMLRNMNSVLAELYNSFVGGRDTQHVITPPPPSLRTPAPSCPPIRLDNKPNRVVSAPPVIQATPPPAYQAGLAAGGEGGDPNGSDSSDSEDDHGNRKSKKGKKKKRRNSNSSDEGLGCNPILSPNTPFKLRSQDVSTFDPADKSFRVMAFIAELRNLKNKYGEASIMDLFPKQLRGEARALYNAASRGE